MSDVVHYSEMVRTACGLKDWDFGSMDWVHVTCLDCLRAELRRYQAIEKAAEKMEWGTNFLMEYLKDNDLIDCCCDDGDPTTGQPGITCEYHIAELTLADYRKAKAAE